MVLNNNLGTIGLVKLKARHGKNTKLKIICYGLLSLSGVISLLSSLPLHFQSYLMPQGPEAASPKGCVLPCQVLIHTSPGLQLLGVPVVRNLILVR